MGLRFQGLGFRFGIGVEGFGVGSLGCLIGDEV